MGGWQYSMLQAMKENVDLLTGARGESDAASQAILKSSVTVQPVNVATLSISAQGFSVPTGTGASVPTIDDYNQLLTDARRLADAVSSLQETLNLLITQLRS